MPVLSVLVISSSNAAWCSSASEISKLVAVVESVGFLITYRSRILKSQSCIWFTLQFPINIYHPERGKQINVLKIYNSRKVCFQATSQLIFLRLILLL